MLSLISVEFAPASGQSHRVGGRHCISTVIISMNACGRPVGVFRTGMQLISADFSAALGITMHEYQTDIGPADHVLFADGQAVGVVEAKPDNQGVRLTKAVRAQKPRPSGRCANRGEC